MAAISLYELSDMVFCLPAEQDVCRCIIFEILHSMFFFLLVLKRDATQTWRIWSIVSIQTHNTPASGIGSGSHELPVDSYLILRLESLVGLQEIHVFPVL